MSIKTVAQQALLTVQCYPALEQGSQLACTIFSAGLEVAVAQPGVGGLSSPYPEMPQSPQWGYSGLCQQNCWCRSKQPGVMLGCSVGGVRIWLKCCSHPFLVLVSPLPHPTPCSNPPSFCPPQPPTSAAPGVGWFWPLQASPHPHASPANS